MAVYPKAVKKFLPENRTQAHIVPTQIILHTAVSSASSLYGFFHGGTNLESHFYVANDGTVEQYIDTEVRADANLEANVRAISIETEDDGHPDREGWTPAQHTAIVELLSWLCRTHKIPVRKCPAWDKPGIGYHTLFGAPSKWTPSRGKTCPGPKRIAQFPSIIAGVASHANAAVSVPARVVKRAVPVEKETVVPKIVDAAAAVWQVRLGRTDKNMMNAIGEIHAMLTKLTEESK